MRRALVFLLRRLAWAAAIIVGVGSLAFILARGLPGDPVRVIVGPQASAADIERARTIYELDRPMPVQFVRYWSRLVHDGVHPPGRGDHRSCRAVAGVHVDLGWSHGSRKPVVELIATRAPRSLQLAALAILLQVLLGAGVGTFAATRRGTAADQASIAASMIAVSAPTFVIGVLLQYVLAYRLGWLPLDGGSASPLAIVLPALTLGLYGSAVQARMTREELGRALESDYVRSARARGASPWRVLRVHAWRNALAPVLTLVVLEFGALVGGAIVTEKLFRWPGLGALTVDAILNRDAPLLLGAVLVSAAAVAAASLLLDLLQLALDPRLRR